MAYTDEQVALLNAERDGRLAVTSVLELFLDYWDVLPDDERKQHLINIVEANKK